MVEHRGEWRMKMDRKDIERISELRERLHKLYREEHKDADKIDVLAAQILSIQEKYTVFGGAK